MRKARHIYLWAMCLCALSLYGQVFDPGIYLNNDTSVARYMARENYAKALPIIEAQIEYLNASQTPDSLFRYVYRLGRSKWKLHGADAGISASESLLARVLELDTNRMHQLQAVEDMSWVYYEIGRNDDCLKTDLRYLAIARDMPHASPRVRSIAYYSVGFDYMQLGQWSKAVEYFSQATKPLLAPDVQEPGMLVNTFNSLGAAHMRVGNFAEARKAFASGLEALEKLENQEEKLIHRSNFKGNLSLIYEYEGDIVTAKSYLYEAMTARRAWLELEHEPWRKDQQRKLLASNYHNLGALYFRLGDFGRAKQILAYEKTYKARVFEPGHPEINRTLETLGSIQVALQEYDSALVSLHQYYKACLEDYGLESYFTGTALQRLAKLYLSQNQYAEALDAYDKAISIFASVSDPNKGQDLAECYMMRARVYAQLNAQSLALADADKAASIYAASRTGADMGKGEAWLVKAKLHMQFGEWEAALMAVDSALVQLQGRREFLQNQSSERVASLSPNLPDAHFVKASLLHQMSDHDTGAEPALNELSLAIAMLRDNKRAFDADEAQLYLYEDHAKIFNLAINLQYASWKAQPDEAKVNNMFTMAEEGRAILLRRQLAGFSSLKLAEVPDSILLQERNLIAKLTGRSNSTGEKVDYFQIEEEYAALQAYIQEKFPAYFRLRYDEKVASIDEVRSSLLNQGETLIRYMVTEAMVYALCINSQSASVHALNVPDLDARVLRLNQSIVQNDMVVFKPLAKAFYNELIAPLLSQIEGEVIYIIPDKSLFSLNFETLIDPESQDYLLKSHVISYFHSATSALQFDALSAKRNKGALAFAPGFSDQVKAIYANAVSDSALYDPGYQYRIQQPFAVGTAERVSGMFAGQAFTGVGATEERFKEKAGDFGIIHLGTHTEINNLSPLLSRLVLSKSAEGQEDGYLHAFEIYNLPLRAELAVLTACETGIGKRVGSEGVMSLAHSFAYAGVPSIVMSLWQIDEKTSAEIIENFYAELAEGLPKNVALRNAKLQYLESHGDDLSAPYYWSGLVLIGDVNPVSASKGQPWWLYISLIAILAIVLFWISKKRLTA